MSLHVCIDPSVFFVKKKQHKKIFMYPKSWLLAVEGPAVLVPVLVGLVLGPALEVPGGARHPDPAPLMVHVSGPHPPGVLLVTPSSCGKNKGLLGAQLSITQSAHRWWGTWRSCPSPPGRWARPGRSSGSSSTASRQTSPCHILPRDQRRSRSWHWC